VEEVLSPSLFLLHRLKREEGLYLFPLARRKEQLVLSRGRKIVFFLFVGGVLPLFPLREKR